MKVSITSHQSITCYPTQAKAQTIADENNAIDDWNYTVRENSLGFYIVIHDEDGEFVGTL